MEELTIIFVLRNLGYFFKPRFWTLTWTWPLDIQDGQDLCLKRLVKCLTRNMKKWHYCWIWYGKREIILLNWCFGNFFHKICVKHFMLNKTNFFHYFQKMDEFQKSWKWTENWEALCNTFRLNCFNVKIVQKIFCNPQNKTVVYFLPDNTLINSVSWEKRPVIRVCLFHLHLMTQ